MSWMKIVLSLLNYFLSGLHVIIPHLVLLLETHCPTGRLPVRYYDGSGKAGNAGGWTAGGCSVLLVTGTNRKSNRIPNTYCIQKSILFR